MNLFAELTTEAEQLIKDNIEMVNANIYDWIENERKIKAGVAGDVLRQLAIIKRRRNPGQKELKVTPERKNAINKLIKQGVTMQEFVMVIECKIAKWSGTDFEANLRPETLFGKRFFSYLEESQEWKSKGGNKKNPGITVGAIKRFGE